MRLHNIPQITMPSENALIPQAMIVPYIYISTVWEKPFEAIIFTSFQIYYKSNDPGASAETCSYSIPKLKICYHFSPLREEERAL